MVEFEGKEFCALFLLYIRNKLAKKNGSYHNVKKEKYSGHVVVFFIMFYGCIQQIYLCIKKVGMVFEEALKE